MAVGLEPALAEGLEPALAVGLATVFTAFVTAFFSTALGTGLEAAVLAGAGLLCDLATAAGLALADALADALAEALAGALALAGELVFFTAVFELVLRGFFTSCLLAVAAYASFQDTSHLQMNCGHRLICVKTHIFRPSGRIRATIKLPRQGADCSD